MFYNQLTNEGKRVMSISTADCDKMLLEDVLVLDHDIGQVLKM